MGKIGILSQVSGTSLEIDGTWYDASKIQQYIPKQIGIQVEYDADENMLLRFVRPQGAYTPKNTGAGPRRKKAFTPKPGFDKARTDSIIKQVIFKVAGQLAQGLTFGSTDEAVNIFDDLYNKLSAKYKEGLK
jgi:hypothetical protein